MKKVETQHGLPALVQPLALATSSAHYYVCVILLPVLAHTKYFSLTTFEVGVMFTGQTAGVMLSYKFIESTIKMFGLTGVINLGFLILICSNFGLWIIVLLTENSSDFATCVFLTRLVSGIGCGLIEASCLISRIQHREDPDNNDATNKLEIANNFFKRHKTFEALGNLIGPLVVITVYPFIGSSGVFLILAIASFIVWMICAILIAYEREKYEQAQKEQAPNEKQVKKSPYSSFVRSMLYNQIPLRAYLNFRSVLAQTTLFVAWTCATFFLPFYAVYAREKDVVQVSVQIASVTFIVLFTIFFSNIVVDRISSPHIFNMINLILISSGCWIMGMKQTQSNYYFDASVGGYLLIACATAFISTTAFKETLQGTQSYIELTSWREMLNMDEGSAQVYVETACLCQSIIQFAFVFGPPLGGGLSHRKSMSETCFTMGIVSSIFFGIYVVGATYILCMKTNPYNQPDTLQKNLKLWKKKKQDDLGFFLNELADQKSLPACEESPSRSNSQPQSPFNRILQNK